MKKLKIHEFPKMYPDLAFLFNLQILAVFALFNPAKIVIVIVYPHNSKPNMQVLSNFALLE